MAFDDTKEPPKQPPMSPLEEAFAILRARGFDTTETALDDETTVISAHRNEAP